MGIVFFHPDGADELLAPSLPCGPCLAECECSSLIEAHSRGDILALSYHNCPTRGPLWICVGSSIERQSVCYQARLAFTLTVCRLLKTPNAAAITDALES